MNHKDKNAGTTTKGRKALPLEGVPLRPPAVSRNLLRREERGGDIARGNPE